LSAIQTAIEKLAEGRPVNAELAGQVAHQLLSGEATDAQIGAFLMAMRVRGERPEHLAAFAQTMRDHASPVFIADKKHLVDTCGTGGDRSGTFNISTTAALIAAGAGARVAKHGNRAISGKCGSADVLAALGVKIDMSPDTVTRCMAEAGVAFFFAPIFHQSMRHVGPARKELGVRTIFNMLGPLSNPAGAAHQLIGVYSEELTEIFAEVLIELGSKHVMIVHGEDGLDEITTTGRTLVTEATKKERRTYHLNPVEFGIDRAQPADLLGGETVEANADIVLAILEGEGGARADVAVLNAAAALYVGAQAESIEEGVAKARESIRSGAARETLENFVRISNEDTVSGGA
jgi:anthranilate phosphoribosyltransferase